MKKRFRKLICLLFSAILLVSGSGLVVGKMTCLKTGKSLVQLSASQNCCGEKSQGTALYGKCCELKNIVFSPGNYVSASHLIFKAQFSSASHFTAMHFLSLDPLAASADRSVNHSPPPRLQGKSFLHFTQAFRV